MMRRLLVLGVVFALAIPCFGGSKSREFNALVKAIETDYGVRRVRIPLLGFATFCVRVAGTPGTAGLKIAVFDDLGDSNAPLGDSFQQSVEAAMGSAWHPLVRARSPKDGDVVLIYVNPDPKDLEVLIVWVGEDQATVVQTKLKNSQIRNWITHPQDAVDRDSMHAGFSIAADDQ
jgi:hypothetical protein